MGDHYQIAVDLDAEAETAALTASQSRRSMISQEIIVNTPSDCVLGETLGYAPGKKYMDAVDEPYPMLFQLQTNGVAFIAKRSVFSSVGISEVTLICSKCRERFEWSRTWQTAVEEWYGNTGPGMLSCRHCGREASVAEWEYDPPHAFGQLGVEFWNWPPLREDFLARMAQEAGHRFRLVYGNL